MIVAWHSRNKLTVTGLISQHSNGPASAPAGFGTLKTLFKKNNKQTHLLSLVLEAHLLSPVLEMHKTLAEVTRVVVLKEWNQSC